MKQTKKHYLLETIYVRQLKADQTHSPCRPSSWYLSLMKSFTAQVWFHRGHFCIQSESDAQCSVILSPLHLNNVLIELLEIKAQWSEGGWMKHIVPILAWYVKTFMYGNKTPRSSNPVMDLSHVQNWIVGENVSFYLCFRFWIHHRVTVHQTLWLLTILNQKHWHWGRAAKKGGIFDTASLVQTLC